MGRRPALIIICRYTNSPRYFQEIHAEYSECQLVHPAGLNRCEGRTYPDTYKCKLYKPSERYRSSGRCYNMYRKLLDPYIPGGSKSNTSTFLCCRYVSIPVKGLDRVPIKEYAYICQNYFRSI